MTQLTQESFERILQDRLQEAVAPLATKQDVREAVGELARITSSGFARTEERFDEVEKRLDVRELFEMHERKFKKLEEALHISLVANRNR